jgi:hypothetical protein
MLRTATPNDQTELADTIRDVCDIRPTDANQRECQ